MAISNQSQLLEIEFPGCLKLMGMRLTGFGTMCDILADISDLLSLLKSKHAKEDKFRCVDCADSR